MACRVRYLNSSGLMPREIKGIQALSKAFPSEWLLYASLNCFPRGQSPIEIDAMVVMDDRILLLEIKDWNGNLSCHGDVWRVNGQVRGRSPVVLGNEKAKKLKSVLKSEFNSIGTKIYVESKVVLTGTASKKLLPQNEIPHVWSLLEACSISDPIKKSGLLTINTTLSLTKLFKHEAIFERIVNNSKIFQPLEADWNGYQVVEPNIFVHPNGVWIDHRAERRDEARIKGMVRTWFFDKLPVGLNSPDRRQLIAGRETKAFAYLQEMNSELIAQGKLLHEISAPHDEILTNHFEVRAIAQGWNTLDRYLERAREDLSIADRIVIVSALLSIVSKLHQLDVTHRDLGTRNIWIGSPSDLAMTGFMSCQLPDQESVVDWLTALRGYAPELPEDRSNDNNIGIGTGRQRDVYMCAYLVVFVLTDKRPEKGVVEAVRSLPKELEYLSQWVEKGLSSDPVLRFTDAIEMAEEFSELIEPNKTAFVDQSILDNFQTTSIPYITWPPQASLPSKAGCSVYESTKDGAKVIVKVWNGITRGVTSANDLSLLRLLENAARLKDAPIRGFPIFVDIGLSSVGPYIVYEHFDGVPLKSIEQLDTASALLISRDLLSAVSALHDLGCDHGDISPNNILVGLNDHSICLVDVFDISNVGDGSIRTPSMCPQNWERLSQQSLDRFAAVQSIVDFLSKNNSSIISDVLKLFNDELERPVIESLEFAITTLNNAIFQCSSPAKANIRISTKLQLQKIQNVRGFFIRREVIDQQSFVYYLTNPTLQLILEGDKEKLISHQIKLTKYTTLSHESLYGEFTDIEMVLEEGEESGVDKLYEYLTQIDGTNKDERISPAKNSVINTFDVESRWKRLIALEEQGRVEIEIVGSLTSQEGVTIYRYQNIGKEFDFDPDDVIEVMNGGNKRIGEVDYGLSDFPGTIAIRGDIRRISTGDRLRLADRREQVSIDRRTKAIDRILSRRSAIPELVDYFSPNAQMNPTDFGVEAIEADLEGYNLNKGQKEAFHKLLRFGPVGLLQGPPGTGKTRFIASFVHWLLTKGGSQRILIASQSHEAVNNAIESLIMLYKRLGGKPNLLRIGSKGITERIKPYHSAELRERYRVRFEVAAKFRFTQLTSAKGISRAFAAELFDLDNKLGLIARRLSTLKNLMLSEISPSVTEREKSISQIKRLEIQFKEAAKQYLVREVDLSRPLEEFDSIVNALSSQYPDVSPADISAAKKILELTKDWLSSLASPQRNFEEFLAKTRSVVTATCVGVGQTKIRIDSQVFDWVIVDEAARCTSGELAVPIQMARRVLLVGDHLQLQPMLSRDLLDLLEDEDGAQNQDDLKISDFERAFTSAYGSKVSARFTEQYRMDEIICKLVSKCFYEPHSVQLQTSSSRIPSFTYKLSSHTWLSKPITWVDTSSHPKEREIRPAGSSSRYNSAEVEAVIALLESIALDKAMLEQLNEGEEEAPIGVICMYARQKTEIEMAWARHAWDPKFRRMVRIDTVDAYQGKENTIVILSLVCSNSKKDIGHVSSFNRCNVALSRAKDRIAIVGSLRMWNDIPTSSPMGAVLDSIKNDPQNSLIIDMKDLL